METMIFVLGGRGLVGSAFVRVLESSCTPHTVLTRDNYAAFAGKACSLFINANGNSRKPLARQDPMADFDANVRSVRQTLVDFRCDRYIHLSSCDVYPDCSSPDTTSEDAPVALSRQSPYGAHKYLGELCVRQAAPDWLIFRLGGFIGPGLKKNAIFDILHGGPLWLDPDSELQFLHTDAAARIILALAAGSTSREVFNLCGRGLVRLRDVMEATGRQVPVQPDSPLVRYDVSIDRISRLVDVPETRPAVLDFAASYTE